MNRLICLLLLLSINFLFSQTFEGKIEYDINYQSKLKSVPSKQLNTLLGTKQAYITR